MTNLEYHKFIKECIMETVFQVKQEICLEQLDKCFNFYK